MFSGPAHKWNSVIKFIIMLLQQRLTLFLLGLAAIIPTSFCHNNHEAPDGKYPYHVNVRRDNRHVCSGSIVNKRYILTSRLCVTNAEVQRVNITVGTNSLTDGGIFYGIEKIIRSTDGAKIVLLQTDKDIEFSDRVQPIKMTDYNYEQNGYPLTLTAWNHPAFGEVTTDKLQEYSYEILDFKKCAEIYRANYDQKDLCIMNSDHKAFCDFDYGGAVVADGVQVGIRYRKDGCNKNGVQVNYRIYYYSKWIEDKTNLEKFEHL